MDKFTLRNYFKSISGLKNYININVFAISVNESLRSNRTQRIHTDKNQRC